MKTINLITFSLVIGSAALFTGCAEEDNPSIDDYPWNYEITEVKAQSDIPVGILVYNNDNVWRDRQVTSRITDPYEPASGAIGPYVKPSAGEYVFVGTDKEYEDEYSETIGNIVANLKKARVDYLITPALNENAGSMYPNNLNGSDTIMVNMISGKADTLAWHNDGSMKYAIRLNVNNIASSLRCNNQNLVLENAEDRTYRVIRNGQQVEVKVPARECIINWFRRVSWFFLDPTYYHFNGRPVLVLDEADKLYVQDVRGLYDDIRAAIRNEVGKDVYIICRQQQWTPPARWTYFWINGAVDAVCPRNLTNLEAGTGWDRSVWYNVFINEHMKVNRQYYANYGINYVPSVSPSYYQYIWSQAYNCPIIRHDPEDFRKRCWAAKMQLGAQPMVIVDAYNEWMFGNAIEPTDEDYGFGWGDKFLNVISQEFKL